MVTTNKLLKIKTYSRKNKEKIETPKEAPRIAFLLNCSSSEREILDE